MGASCSAECPEGGGRCESFCGARGACCRHDRRFMLIRVVELSHALPRNDGHDSSSIVFYDTSQTGSQRRSAAGRNYWRLHLAEETPPMSADTTYYLWSSAPQLPSCVRAAENMAPDGPSVGAYPNGIRSEVCESGTQWFHNYNNIDYPSGEQSFYNPSDASDVNFHRLSWHVGYD